MSYKIVWENRGVYKWFYGTITSDEFLQSIQDLHDHPHFDDIAYSINDFLDVDGYDISELDVKIFAGFGIGAYKSNSKIKIAILTKDGNIRSLVEGYTKISPFPLRIFGSLDDARNWVLPEQK